MAARPHIGGALCSTPQSLAGAHHYSIPCSNAAKTRNPLKFAGFPKPANRSQPLVSQSSPYYDDTRRRYCCPTLFFRLPIHALVAKIQPDKVVRLCRNGDFLRPVFSASRVQHISDMHSKFALRPHYVWKYGRHACTLWTESFYFMFHEVRSCAHGRTAWSDLSAV